MNFTSAEEAKQFGRDLGEAVKEILDPIRSRLASLEADAAKALKYQGVYQRAASYRRGDATTHKSALWVCIADTSDSPGTSNAWQLAVKPAREA